MPRRNSECQTHSVPGTSSFSVKLKTNKAPAHRSVLARKRQQALSNSFAEAAAALNVEDAAATDDRPHRSLQFRTTSYNVKLPDGTDVTPSAAYRKAYHGSASSRLRYAELTGLRDGASHDGVDEAAISDGGADVAVFSKPNNVAWAESLVSEAAAAPDDPRECHGMRGVDGLADATAYRMRTNMQETCDGWGLEPATQEHTHEQEQLWGLPLKHRADNDYESHGGFHQTIQAHNLAQSSYPLQSGVPFPVPLLAQTDETFSNFGVEPFRPLYGDASVSADSAMMPASAEAAAQWRALDSEYAMTIANEADIISPETFNLVSCGYDAYQVPVDQMSQPYGYTAATDYAPAPDSTQGSWPQMMSENRYQMDPDQNHRGEERRDWERYHV